MTGCICEKATWPCQQISSVCTKPQARRDQLKCQKTAFYLIILKNILLAIRHALKTKSFCKEAADGLWQALPSCSCQRDLGFDLSRRSRTHCIHISVHLTASYLLAMICFTHNQANAECLCSFLHQNLQCVNINICMHFKGITTNIFTYCKAHMQYMTCPLMQINRNIFEHLSVYIV